MQKHTPQLIHQIEKESIGIPIKRFLILLFVVIVAGGLVGFTISKMTPNKKTVEQGASVKNENQEGIADKKTFKDSAEGVLKEGGIDGEGNFHLERPGGISQNVYLTSTTVDLSQYIGKKIRVHGETFSGQKAGWLMDVGLVESL